MNTEMPSCKQLTVCKAEGPYTALQLWEFKKLQLAQKSGGAKPSGKKPVRFPS